MALSVEAKEYADSLVKIALEVLGEDLQKKAEKYVGKWESRPVMISLPLPLWKSLEGAEASLGEDKLSAEDICTEATLRHILERKKEGMMCAAVGLLDLVVEEKGE